MNRSHAKPNTFHEHQFDVLILGSGAAGLSLALQLPDDMSVAVLSKSSLSAGSTFYAQGGISAVLDDEPESIDSHVEDTLVAGAGLCDEGIVRYTVSHGKECITWLLNLGVKFTQVQAENGNRELHLVQEGGHSRRRIVHAADATGRAVQSTLVEHALQRSNIQVFEHAIAIDLITANKIGEQPDQCLGAYILNQLRDRVETIRARFVVIATGGASKVYLYSSNPDGSSGDGIAMAWRAGCRVANMEFMQFHPTCLYHPHARSFLITEAVRGEGGRLLLPNGSEFMHRFDPRGVLAPRDIVARAIDHEMKRLGADSVYLDISHKPASFIKKHFPTVYGRCLELGLDMAKEPIPVVPAAHYTCGGILVNQHAETDVPNLYAIGEASHTGLHGANRMASNSLLECLVFARAAAQQIAEKAREPMSEFKIPAWDESRVTDSDEEVVVSHNWEELRRFMWDYVGIVRTTKRLQRAKHRVDLLLSEIEEYYSNFRVTGDLIELRNLAMVADLIIRCAMSRTESRGLHYTLDYPEASDEQIHNTIISAPSLNEMNSGFQASHRIRA